MQRLSVMVKNAIGYDAARGDVVSVLNAPFVELPAEAVESTPVWLEPWFQETAKMLLIAAVVLGLGVGVLRPAFRMVTRVGSDAESIALAPAPPNPLITDEQLDEAFLRRRLERATPRHRPAMRTRHRSRSRSCAAACHATTTGPRDPTSLSWGSRRSIRSDLASCFVAMASVRARPRSTPA